MKNLIAIPLLVLFLMFGAASVTLASGGTGPGDALLPVGVSQTVAPHSAQWYYFDYGGRKSPIVAAVDDNAAAGIRLAI